MSIKKIVISLAALLLVSVSFLGAARVKADNTSSPQIKKIQKAGVLKVGVKQDVPNFGYYSSKTNDYEGMEIDIARKIAKALGVKIEFTAVTAQTREAVMDNGQVDIVIGTYTITPERTKTYSFSTPYYTDEIGFLVSKSKGFSTIDDLDGKTIGVSQGSTTKASIEEYAKAHHLKFKFVQLGSYPELAISLYANRISAFSVDKSILTGYRSKKTKILSQGFNTQEYGIATKKSNSGITAYIDGLLKKWKKDGSLQKIYKKYNLKPAKSSSNN
ncbi:transporter substrate-binding domain-containing protein [Streptococcus macacae]|uniref:Major cell-binding factor n=1 Tax=Streptococcus macacae NCTC 11558 TaxID=764298 RepID=G5JWI0_9STRE|nr:transporter substrate-binding domain-containing protein [Streptococcus macacae]EHJ51850.1 major cell-binding factor [Streptococcus macacae NCTC 11558]SUN78760.1 putative glutamine transport system substrate-binding protein [Streptococcus macacae NCTC 11558]